MGSIQAHISGRDESLVPRRYDLPRPRGGLAIVFAGASDRRSVDFCGEADGLLCVVGGGYRREVAIVVGVRSRGNRWQCAAVGASRARAGVLLVDNSAVDREPEVLAVVVRGPPRGAAGSAPGSVCHLDRRASLRRSRKRVAGSAAPSGWTIGIASVYRVCHGGERFESVERRKKDGGRRTDEVRSRAAPAGRTGDRAGRAVLGAPAHGVLVSGRRLDGRLAGSMSCGCARRDAERFGSGRAKHSSARVEVSF